jgi:hypothetical protein
MVSQLIASVVLCHRRRKGSDVLTYFDPNIKPFINANRSL